MGSSRLGRGAVNEHGTCRRYSGAHGRRPHPDKVLLLCVCCILQETRCETNTALTLLDAVPARGSSPRGKLLEHADQLELEDRGPPESTVKSHHPGAARGWPAMPETGRQAVSRPVGTAKVACNMHPTDVTSLLIFP